MPERTRYRHDSKLDAVSVRLDDEVRRALNTLEASGMSRPEAIRKAILDAAAAQQRKATLQAEAAVLDADEFRMPKALTPRPSRQTAARSLPGRSTFSGGRRCRARLGVLVILQWAYQHFPSILVMPRRNYPTYCEVLNSSSGGRVAQQPSGGALGARRVLLWARATAP